MKKFTYTDLLNSSQPYREKLPEKGRSFGFPKYIAILQNIQTPVSELISSSEVYERLHNKKMHVCASIKNFKIHDDLIFTVLTHEKENIPPQNASLEHVEITGAVYESVYLKPSLQPPAINADLRYAIDISKVIHYEDKRTTCMLKNIPNKYTQSMLIDLLNEHHCGCFDFVYLRMDFKNKCNVGYAFVNFTSCSHVASFYQKVNNMKWKTFSSNKIAELTYATIQGYDNLVKKFRNSVVMKERGSYRPKVFYKDGPLKGQENAMGI